MKRQVYQNPAIRTVRLHALPVLTPVSAKTNLEGLGGGSTSGNQGEAWSRGNNDWDDDWDDDWDE